MTLLLHCKSQPTIAVCLRGYCQIPLQCWVYLPKVTTTRVLHSTRRLRCEGLTLRRTILTPLPVQLSVPCDLADLLGIQSSQRQKLPLIEKCYHRIAFDYVAAMQHQRANERVLLFSMLLLVFRNNSRADFQSLLVSPCSYQWFVAFFRVEPKNLSSRTKWRISH